MAYPIKLGWIIENWQQIHWIERIKLTYYPNKYSFVRSEIFIRLKHDYLCIPGE